MTDTSASRGGVNARPLALRVLGPVLSGIRSGTLNIGWPDGSTWTYDGAAPGPAADVNVSHPARALRRMLYRGANGFADSYVAGDWDSPALGAVLDLALANARPDALVSDTAFPGEYADRLVHLVRPNTKHGSRRNILAHYDLGNDFYRLWLDPSMTYSCGLFDASCRSLEEAQVRKWDRLLALLDPREGSTLLEIGCGWGGFAIHAAATRGVRVTGITVSDAQHAWATEAARRAGVSDLVEIRLQDYRDVPGRFDNVVSIEMFEAVGMRYWPVFFRSLRDRLAVGGTAAMQVITIANERFDDYRRRPDFIQRHVFPGGMLPSTAVFEAAASDGGFAMMPPHFFGHDYAVTLEEWERRLVSSIARVRALGFDESFERTWRYYLAYCAAGFRSGVIDVMQVALR